MRKQNENNYTKILNFVEGLHVTYNTSVRIDCPCCGGNNTFSVSHTNTGVVWYCFRDSCKIKGYKKGKIDLFAAEDFLEPKQKEVIKPLPIKDFVGWVNVEASTEAMEYLYKNNCMEAYKLEPNRFFYDKTQERIVFVQYSTANTVKLATGRSLKGQVPKWFKYLALPGVYFEAPTFIGDTDTIFIAEDCASACSLSRLDYALALCGTNYSLYALSHILPQAKERVVICLDNDAQLTALKLQNDLRAIGDFKVNIKMLSDDAKYLSIDILKKELNYGN